MITASATLLAACLAIIGIITGSSLMASIPLEQLSLAQQSENKSTQLENGIKEKNNKAVVIAFTEAFNDRNASALDNLVAQM